ncbi:dipeptidase [Paucibacter sp. R3-3]|uniref:Dipeptidase n=1 Tax=Roseateles agri TaxID=3098619 RepID=A0ABU5DKC9_9BURK|nr:dipeptidase [Paucibacter sp. R3-3]MDY0746752.1 dipeptidase [Paucibacter sp. R3-3]
MARIRNSIALVAGLLLAAVAMAVDPAGPVVSKTARALHEQLLTLDSHLDTPMNFELQGWDILQRHDALQDGSQVDLPRLIEGGLDGGFWAIYTPQGPRTAAGVQAARDAAFAPLVAIRELVAAHPRQFELALKADDAARIAAGGKRVVFLSIENGFPVEGDPGLLQTFQRLGVRLAGPVHLCNNGLADSSTDPQGPEWHGLSEQGRRFVAEANRLGIVLDASHASDEVLDQLIELSRTPVLLSHSGLKAVFDHPRNIDDARLRRLAASGGVIQINFLSDYLIATPHDPARDQALQALWADARTGPPTLAARQALIARKAEIERRWPVPRASFEDAFAHLLHAIRVAGIEHVGIGADFDGGGGVTGFEDARDYPKITARLLAEGFGPAEIQQVWSGNLLRVLRAAETYAQGLQARPVGAASAPSSP